MGREESGIGGSGWMGRYGGGSIRATCQVKVGFFVRRVGGSFFFKCGTDRRFRNVGKSQSDAGGIPKRIHTILLSSLS
jgi:hypothetical protein